MSGPKLSEEPSWHEVGFPLHLREKFLGLPVTKESLMDVLRRERSQEFRDEELTELEIILSIVRRYHGDSD